MQMRLTKAGEKALRFAETYGAGPRKLSEMDYVQQITHAAVQQEGEPDSLVHCGNLNMHGAHVHSIMTAEGAYAVQCLGTPRPEPETVPPPHVEVRKERGAGYGDPVACHRNIGLAWKALLQDWWQKELPDIPPHIVDLMMVQLKVLRAAKPLGHRADDYVDARNYLDFAEEADPQRSGQ